MNEWGHLSDCFSRISRFIPLYSAKQIRQHWIYHLCHEPLDEKEKDFIIQEINKLKPDEKISWKKIIKKMEDEFNKLRSENKVKNFWVSYIRKKEKSIQ
ncbi:hypothetical protein C1645_776021 [Glomus cerebriforme]|uniref:HTH myb-type domain-containing protein n=1 Tax=Glomus cerebriforme TaxID=658196 RepID=A0A397SPE5_9GLOM|nr:hypothetical protein C1645_776021 [Glomus cerebriforme]